MNQSLYRVVAALFALTFFVAACASDTGAEWTYAPVTASESQAPGPSEPTAAPGATAEPGGTAAPADTAAPATPPPSSGEPRVIQLQADAALRFTDMNGQPVSDIPVTPGETIIFEVDNTAGFEHNFWIGTDAELSAPYATTDVGIDTWTTGVQSVEWVVPADVSGLKFGCTVPGHYLTMQGTFSASEPAVAAETPPEPEPAAAETTAAPESPAAPAAVSGEPRVIQLQADAALRFTDTSGQQVSDIPVTPGETIIFEVDNTAGFEHDFWIGTDAELSGPYAKTDVGIEPWTTGVQSVEWVVPADVSGLKFGCTVPGHYTTMQGTFSASEPAVAAETPAEPAAAETTAAPGTPAETMAAHEPAAMGGEPRVIELEADAAIRFLQDGEQIREIPVTPGETVVFRIDNTAGFAHNFWIGPDQELQVQNGSTDTGLPDWTTGVQELEWVVPDDVTDLRFACTVPGHYFTMQGDFTISQ